MKPIATVAALATILAGCAAVPQERGPTCDALPAGGCRFDSTPLRVLPQPVVLPRRAWTFFPTAQELNFIDGRGQVWTAPQGTLTDGASIPRIFVSLLGDPTEPEYINAAAMHDAYCGVGNEAGPKFRSAPWEEVHVMFYDGLIASGARPVVAKTMFAAVWLGGPRWRTSRTLDHVPEAQLRQAMRETRDFIARGGPAAPGRVDAGLGAVVSTQGRVRGGEGPSFAVLLAYLRQQERALLRAYPQPPRGDDLPEETPEEEVFEEGDPNGDPATGPLIDPETGLPLTAGQQNAAAQL
ncbi:DUF1353 domain-containing protein [Thetidibacter halocola]|uniref:DUF1353 domain-containing protein n=1 Tax=Thetidibacter halocola TaxID=2827239 RepID=A0A8J7WDV7_9RHOB|nr:DUF1353 domain-containing protein [Thetidibacter halocola]MBS0124604.1 DUF1353 domain-containing protein [Thetidibacter halocola]